MTHYDSRSWIGRVHEQFSMTFGAYTMAKTVEFVQFGLYDPNEFGPEADRGDRWKAWKEYFYFLGNGIEKGMEQSDIPLLKAVMDDLFSHEPEYREAINTRYGIQKPRPTTEFTLYENFAAQHGPQAVLGLIGYAEKNVQELFSEEGQQRVLKTEEEWSELYNAMDIEPKYKNITSDTQPMVLLEILMQGGREYMQRVKKRINSPAWYQHPELVTEAEPIDERVEAVLTPVES